jgi:hypothetical protein
VPKAALHAVSAQSLQKKHALWSVFGHQAASAQQRPGVASEEQCEIAIEESVSMRATLSLSFQTAPDLPCGKFKWQEEVPTNTLSPRCHPACFFDIVRKYRNLNYSTDCDNTAAGGPNHVPSEAVLPRLL